MEQVDVLNKWLMRGDIPALTLLFTCQLIDPNEFMVLYESFRLNEILQNNYVSLWKAIRAVRSETSQFKIAKQPPNKYGFKL